MCDNVSGLDGRSGALTRLAVRGSRRQDSYLPRVAGLFARLLAAGFSLSVERRFAAYLSGHGLDLSGMEVVDEVPDGTQAIVSLGGDGTMLRSAQWAAGRPLPVLGINTGHLGFLSHFSLDDCDMLPGLLRGGTLTGERRVALTVSGAGIPPGVWPYAFNEVTILKEETSSMITVHTTLDGYFLADYLADGLIMSTPTGSTGYSLSVGGPIVQPTLDCRVLSPIAPHSLTMRPLVVAGDAVVEATTTSRADTYRVSLDGRSFVMRCGTTLRVSRAPFALYILRRPGDNFARTLRDKLLWSRR